MSSIKLPHSSGNAVSIAAPQSNPASDRTLYVPSNADGTILTTTSGSSLQVLEQFYLLADGRSVSTSNGTVTTTDVTAAQALTDSFVTATGSSLTYQPPTGTTEVIYEYKCILNEDNTNDKILVFYYLDIDGTQILESRQARYAGGDEYNDDINIKYGFRVGTSDSATTGDRASWSSNKTLTIKVARYSSNYAGNLHVVEYFTPGGGASDFVRRPYVGITAIGVPS